MNEFQKVAITNPCYLAEEATDLRFARGLPRGTCVVLTVNAGYE